MTRNKLRSMIIIGIILFFLLGIVLIIIRMNMPSQDYNVTEETSNTTTEITSSETETKIETTTENETLVQASNETDDGSLTVGISLNDVEVSTFDSIEKALESPVKILSSTITVKMSTSENVKAVQISTYDTDGTAHNDEAIVWSDSNWQYKLKLKDYIGNTIIVNVSATDMQSKNAMHYFAVLVAE